jgi:uncharacterized MnhB-related membrane protein
VTTLHHDTSVRRRGAAVVAAALGFVGAFVYLILYYPDVLQTAAIALPALLGSPFCRLL